MSNLWKRAAFALLLGFGLTFGGVVSAQMGAKDEPKKEEPKAEAKKLDTPWTLDEVKKAMKAGQTAKFKLVSTYEGKDTVYLMTQEVTEVSDKGYKSKTTTTDADGKAMGEPTEESKNWDDFYKGLDFTDADTKITEGKAKVGAGEFDCKIYTQTKDENGSKTTTAYYFVKDKPGYIAKLTSESVTGEIKSSYSMELTEAK